ncbi:gap junction beta-3 -like protein [Labeo rohita]|uniref:Gap junction beta-3-like protein n=1 Tax=Labeo rohita TaxID=84645 RepID=A0A498LNP4_LABRO|nr:gap junction beta-5 protein [Labeo rohita]RXN09671.1 gap junction beta-3 -like protein [Labeo rohita]
MAAIVTGLIPILRTAVDSTATYKGRTMWFGLLCIRLVTVFLAQFPWKSLNEDFDCDTPNKFCVKACFNTHFDNSIVMAWHFLFILLVLSVLLMELFSSHLRSAFQKKKEREMASQGEQGGVTDPTMTVGGRMMIDLHKSKSSVVVYLLSVMLRIAVEVLFVYVLVCWVLPKLDLGPYSCDASFSNCSEVKCVVRGVAEKKMSVYALLFISALVIITSGMFCLYSIGHYLCDG